MVAAKLMVSRNSIGIALGRAMFSLYACVLLHAGVLALCIVLLRRAAPALGLRLDQQGQFL